MYLDLIRSEDPFWDPSRSGDPSDLGTPQIWGPPSDLGTPLRLGVLRGLDPLGDLFGPPCWAT